MLSINDFISQNEIAGNLTANGDVRFDHLQTNGVVRASGNQLKYRGIILQSLDLDAAFKISWRKFAIFELTLILLTT